MRKKWLSLLLALMLAAGMLAAVPVSALAEDPYEAHVKRWVAQMEEKAASADHILGGVNDVDTIRRYTMTIILPGETVAVVPDATYNPQGIQGGIGAFTFNIFQLNDPEVNTDYLREGSVPARTTFTELEKTDMEYPWGAYEIEGATHYEYVSLYRNDTGYPVVVRGEHGPSRRNVTTKSLAAPGGRSFEGYTTRQQAFGTIFYAPLFYFVEPYYELKLTDATADGTPYEWFTDAPEMTLKVYMDHADHTYTVNNPVVPGRVFQRWEKTEDPHCFNIHQNGVSENGVTSFTYNMETELRKTSKTGSMSPRYYASDGVIRAYFYNDSYTVRFHPGEGQKSFLAEAGHDDVFTLNLTDYTPEREGYVFLGWCTDESKPKETILENATAENRDAWFPKGSSNRNLDVYAVWEEALDYSLRVETDAEAGEVMAAWKETEDGTQCRLKDGTVLTGWQKLNGAWYVFSEEGILQTGWVQSGGKWYYMDASGAMQTGWLQSGGAWYYMDASGAMQTGWVESGGAWYYMNASGVMQTGWVEIGGAWYYMGASGAMRTGWVQSGGAWYYLKSSGAMATGFTQIGGVWYYFNDSGVMQTGWLQRGGTWYYLADSGAMVADSWLGIRHENQPTDWYWFDANGAMAMDWLWMNDAWYYFGTSGRMVTGAHIINGTEYIFSSTGALLE